MADRPILFSETMIRALLAGTKTQTRRLFKNIEQLPSGNFHIYANGGGVVGVREEDVPAQAPDYARIQIGDRLWVRESLQCEDDKPDLGLGPIPSPYYVYAADSESVDDHTPAGGAYRKSVPSIHMWRWASRLTLTVTDVRVERLHNISEEDAIAEGVPSDDDYAGSFEKEYCHHCGGSGLHGAFGDGYGVTEVDCAECATPKLRYRNLWNHINGAGAWDANPWVVAYSFEVHRGNIDKIAQVAA